MNIYLIPYTWLRHLAMGLWCGGAGLLAWWGVLSFYLLWSPSWIAASWDGPILFSSISTAVAMASVTGESNLRRRALGGRVWRLLLVFVFSMVFTLVWYVFWHRFSLNLLSWLAPDLQSDALDLSLVNLRYRVGAFAMCGISTGIAVMINRGIGGWKGMINHIGGGMAAGLTAGLVWFTLNNRSIFSDLYLAGAGMGFTWGFVFGLLSWGIPDDLYAGWLRVLSYHRFGHRIPIDASAKTPKERFVGHYPRGLDLYLPQEDGVMELHVSVAADSSQRYWLRGLTLQSTLLRRFLERIDLRYDARRPAPFQTRLRSGDYIRLGEGERHAALEFLMLPREER